MCIVYNYNDDDDNSKIDVGDDDMLELEEYAKFMPFSLVIVEYYFSLYCGVYQKHSISCLFSLFWFIYFSWSVFVQVLCPKSIYSLTHSITSSSTLITWSGVYVLSVILFIFIYIFKPTCWLSLYNC